LAKPPARLFVSSMAHDSYGAAEEQNEMPKRLYGSGSKQRMNVIAVCLSHFIPWILFVTVYSVSSFSLRRQQPLMFWAILILAIVLVLACGALALDAVRKKRAGEAGQPSWYIFLFLTCLLAFILAAVGGAANFSANMAGAFDLQNLNDYAYVDPTRNRGQQMMDVGRISFLNGTHLDLKYAMGFTNGDVYCAAPITLGTAPLSSYDFWAVGKNCCTGSAGNFHCGDYANSYAHAGLRIVSDEPREFYRLAVQQAQATFNIRAEHPLFFVWTQDPFAEQAALLDACWRFFFVGVVAHFLLQLFLVLACACAFGNYAEARKLFA